MVVRCDRDTVMESLPGGISSLDEEDARRRKKRAQLCLRCLR